MPITSSDIKLYVSSEQSDASTNGGRISQVIASSNVKNSVFPDITISERASGLIRFRKVFYKAQPADDTLFQGADIFLDAVTPGEDRVVIFPGTQTGTQGSETSSPSRLYGIGTLDSTVASGVQSVDALIEDSGDTLFVLGDTIRISDKANVNESANNEEYRVITSVNPSGAVITLGFVGGLVNGYSSTNTTISSLYPAGDLKAISGVPAVVSSGGSYNGVATPVEVHSDSTLYQVWTLTFTTPTAFDIVGDTLGNVATGTTASGAQPVNPTFSSPYFELLAVGFSGTFSAGDTITFTTQPSAKSVWLRQTVDAGAGALGSDFTVLAIRGESA